jgi:hypothetical protein
MNRTQCNRAARIFLFVAARVLRRALRSRRVIRLLEIATLIVLVLVALSFFRKWFQPQPVIDPAVPPAYELWRQYQ